MLLLDQYKNNIPLDNQKTLGRKYLVKLKLLLNSVYKSRQEGSEFFDKVAQFD